jgi:hypothetical protein
MDKSRSTRCSTIQVAERAPGARATPAGSTSAPAHAVVALVSDAQDRAIAFVRARAAAARPEARAALASLLAEHAAPPIDALAEQVRRRARIALAFHPDRPLADGRTVVERLLAEGLYRAQFETGISNGSRTAFPGGDRDRWEQTLFGGAYAAGAHPSERPRYGSVDLLRHADGPSPRFGSCYLVLRPHLHARCTLTWGDSHRGPAHVGTMDELDSLLLAMMESVASRGEALGLSGLDPGSFLARIGAPEPTLSAASRPVGRALDDYIEAQIHAPITLADDVATLVIDPAFDDTPTGTALERLASTCGLALDRHPGFVLAPAEVPADFRGPRMPALAELLDRRFAASPGVLDCAVIGRAARALHDDPAGWASWGSTEQTLQELKQLWHVLVRFGRARQSPSDSRSS